MTSLCAIFFLLTAPTFAQTVGGGSERLHRLDGESSGYAFGGSVSGAGDVNGDGFGDVIVGAVAAAGSAYVYSGIDGSLLYQWNAGAAFDSFGDSVSGAGDVNADGFDDLIVGAYLADPGGLDSAGSAYVYSGADGSLLYQWNGGVTEDHFGRSVSGAGDVNDDGFDDVIVGVPLADPGGLANAGSAYVYSGRDGSLLHQLNGEDTQDHFGVSVSDAGNVNGDSFADVIVGADDADYAGQTNAGSAYIYSGANGSLLHKLNGGDIWDLFGRSVSGAGDVNGDGFDDVIVGAYAASPGRLLYAAGSAYVYSGADGSLLHQWDGNAAEDYFGISVSGAGDVNGDGFDDGIVGAFWADPRRIFGAGSAYVYGFHPFLLANTPIISASPGGVLNLALDFPDNAAFHDYIILMSIHGTGPINYGVKIPLNLDSYFLDSAIGNYPFTISSNLHGTLDASGNAAADITFPAGAYNFAIGRTFWLAAVTFPTGQLPTHSSVAVAIEIVP